MQKSALAFVLVMVFCVCHFAHAQEASANNRTMLTVRFKGINLFTFNALKPDYSTGVLELKNPTRKDTVVKLSLSIDQPYHIFFQNVLVDPEKKNFLTRRGSLILFPGDSIALTDNGFRVAHNVNYSNYLDSLLDLDGLYSSNKDEVQKSIATLGLRTYLNIISNRFEKNALRIDSLNLPVDKANVKESFQALNLLAKAQRLFSIAEAYKLSPNEQKVFDSSVNGIRLAIPQMAILMSPYVYSTLYALTVYQARLKGQNGNDFWRCISFVDSELKESRLYKDFILHRLTHDYNGDIDSLYKILEAISTAKIADPRYGHLLNAKEALKADRNLAASSDMATIDGDKVNYFKFIDSLKGKYILVDFWASWCGPCRLQMPYLAVVKKQLKDKPIQFIAISIDEDDKVGDWIEASKDEGLSGTTHSYRLTGGHYNSLLKMLEIEAVPRYLLYDARGKLVNRNFTTPDKPGFIHELSGMIK